MLLLVNLHQSNQRTSNLVKDLTPKWGQQISAPAIKKEQRRHVNILSKQEFKVRNDQGKEILVFSEIM